MTKIHYDDFYNSLWEFSPLWDTFELERLLLIEDIEGKLKILLWTEIIEIKEKISKELNELDEDHIFFSDEFWICNSKTKDADKEFFETLWEESRKIGPLKKVRFLSRVKNRGFWFKDREPIFNESNDPKVIVFYSFKGGVGRTTSLAYVALQLAKIGKRVVVIDADLDAPGIGVLFKQEYGRSGLGLMDFLIESKFADYALDDYYHEFKPKEGEPIIVFPSAKIDSNYLEKLSRIDMEPEWDSFPLEKLLVSIKLKLSPDFILIDGRAGLSDSSGLLLNGFANLHVLFGTVSEQSWKGIEYVINRLGKQRTSQGFTQADCLLVQTMIPSNSIEEIRKRFFEKAKSVFEKGFYLPSEDRDKSWSVFHLQDPIAPHNQITVRYDDKFAAFKSISDLEPDLINSIDHKVLLKRIFSSLGISSE